MKKTLIFYVVTCVTVGILSSCVFVTSKVHKTPEDALKSLGIQNQSDFSVLVPCQQVEVYSKVGAEFLDIDHMTPLVPEWMGRELSKQSLDEITICIAEQGELLLHELGNNLNSENKLKTFRIHALIYLSRDLKIVKNFQVERFILSALCKENLSYRENIAILYYVADGQDIYNFPAPTEIINFYCK